MENTKFTYKPRMGFFLACLAVLISMSLFILLYLSQQPVRSHALGRLLVRLSLDAKLIINILGWGSIAFSAAAAYAVYWTNTLGDRYIDIGNGRIRAPASTLSSKVVEIPFSEVKNINIQKIQSSRIITIHHEKGKIQFPNIMFPEKGDFDKLISVLHDVSETKSQPKNN